MAHDPMKPDEQIAPDMHGFDPLLKPEALALIEGFRNLGPKKGIDTTQNSFYLDSATVTDLLRAERNTNSGYDGLRVMFGLDAQNRIVLLINRVSITENDKGIRLFEYVPQLDTIENAKTHEVILLEYAVLTVNDDGITQLPRIDINGKEYLQLRRNFQAKFADDNPLRTYKNTAQSSLKTLGYDPSEPLSFKRRHFVTGFYIGWRTLELIRDELARKQAGIKLFLGYGALTLNEDSAKCVHLIAIAADNSGDTVEEYPKKIVWSTQDQTPLSPKYTPRTTAPTGASLGQPETPADSTLPDITVTAPLEFSTNNEQPYRAMYTIILGSSCSDSTTETV